MELQITGKNTDVSPTVRSYIERKINKINRRLPNILETKVEITEEKTKSPQQHFVVQATLSSKGTLLRAEHRAEDLLMAIDKVETTLKRQIEHYKGKLHDRGRGNSVARGDFPPETESTEPVPELTRVKRFIIKPMAPDEAIDQMELLGHNFFLFYNLDTDGLNLIYRRRDGNYGLIEPVLK